MQCIHIVLIDRWVFSHKYIIKIFKRFNFINYLTNLRMLQWIFDYRKFCKSLMLLIKEIFHFALKDLSAHTKDLLHP